MGKIDIVTKFDELAKKASEITIKNIEGKLVGTTPLQDDNVIEFLRKNTDVYANLYTEEFKKQLHELAQQDLQNQIKG
ncbi:hypothetical protein [Macrococcoides canis]|uniref:hypothetical protein n=1 Tax=Macrococcoides canis TaxID=1855823 RepID=UPI0020B89B86|nr:hypothetical protein [Macrococcus canis]UTH10935.1 hypothetical protein KFV10_08435 [Macrococcus canis]